MGKGVRKLLATMVNGLQHLNLVAHKRAFRESQQRATLAIRAEDEKVEDEKTKGTIFTKAGQRLAATLDDVRVDADVRSSSRPKYLLD